MKSVFELDREDGRKLFLDGRIGEDTNARKSDIVEKSMFELQRENGKKLYSDGWIVIDCKPFSKTDCDQIKTAVVENGDYGLQVKFFFKQGRSFSYGVSKNVENLSVGDVLDPRKLYWVYLADVGQHPFRIVSDRMEDLFEIHPFTTKGVNSVKSPVVMENMYKIQRENGKKLYYDGWTPKSCNPFSEKDVMAVKSAIVVNGDYGLQIQFFLYSGGSMRFPISKYFADGLFEGAVVEPNKLYWLILSAVGQKDIVKVTDWNELE